MAEILPVGQKTPNDQSIIQYYNEILKKRNLTTLCKTLSKNTVRTNKRLDVRPKPHLGEII